MSFFQSKTTLMLGLALLFAGISLISRSSFVQSGQTAAAISGPNAARTSGTLAPLGYTDRLITASQGQVKKNARDVKALSGLGLAYLQKARESNDPTFYSQAETALLKALEVEPKNYEALSGMGSLELSRHNFLVAKGWGIKARTVSPQKPYAYGVIGDAEIELGDYTAAISSFQQMVDLRPDLGSYSRVSYARELNGDVEGAIEAMRQAIQAGSPAAENTAWSRVQLGNLYFNSNRLAEAERAYNEALNSYPNYLHGFAALAQVRWAQGRNDEAIKLYEQSVANVPLPQYLTALGDLYAQQGDNKSAQKQYDLVQFIFKVFESNGVDVGAEKALFLADYKIDTPQAVKLIEEVVKVRKGIYTEDTLAWSLYRSGRFQEALEAQKRAMQLGTKNPMLFYHLGMIQAALGDKPAARASLARALDMNPFFSIRYASEARRTLESLNK